MAAHGNVVITATSGGPGHNLRPPISNFEPSLWADTFTSSSLDHQVQEKYAEDIAELKEEARSLLTAAKDKTISERLVLIDALERLGVGYHFDQEIEDQLEEIFKSYSGNSEQEDDDLFITSLHFRLLRQHHHFAPCSVFDKFIDQNKKFKESLSNDGKGLLSLYEAAHLRIRGEQILDEGLAFAVHHLRRMVQQLESPLQDRVKRALEQPLHWGIPRVEAHQYISSYEKDDSKNDELLKLAKLDFNYVQNVHKKELQEVCRWWNEVDLKSKLPHARDRVVESYLWAVASCFEPQYSDGRVSFAKSIQMVALLDDTYDNYASVHEAELFTEMIERWNIDEIHQLPDYMKIIYRFVISLYEDYERWAAESGKMFAVPYAIETVKLICRAYNKELKWLFGLEMPKFEDYIANTLHESAFYVAVMAMMPGFKLASKESVDWLMSEPKIMFAANEIGRYLDDWGSYKRESKQGHILTGIDFYMKQHGLSKPETATKFSELAVDAWKDLNAEWMSKTPVPKVMLEAILNLARMSEISYKNCMDAFTSPETVYAPMIHALFVDPITI